MVRFVTDKVPIHGHLLPTFLPITSNHRLFPVSMHLTLGARDLLEPVSFTQHDTALIQASECGCTVPFVSLSSPH